MPHVAKRMGLRYHGHMGRGAYEHNYTSLNLPELSCEVTDAAPVALALRPELSGAGPATVDLYCADNLSLLDLQAAAWAGKFQVLYLDPPFGSGKVYAARIEGGRGRHSQAVRAYRDNQSFDAYLGWLFRRLAFARELLAPSGMLYVHMDWHAVHYVKVELDRLFGRERFLNEVIWCYHGPSPIRSAFKRKHDTILVYTRSDDYFFDADAVRVPYNDSTVKTFASSPRAGFGKMPDLARGKVPEDWWYFPVVARVHSERVGYETQKPEALLERIVKASSRRATSSAIFLPARALPAWLRPTSDATPCWSIATRWPSKRACCGWPGCRLRPRLASGVTSTPATRTPATSSVLRNPDPNMSTPHPAPAGPALPSSGLPWPARLYRWACRRLYHEFAWSYDAVSWLVSAGHWAAWRRLALDYVAGDRVLEVGFGTGELLSEMARRGLNVYGLEPSPAMQRITAAKLRRRRLVVPRAQGFVQHLPFADGCFDTLLATFPAEYIFDRVALGEFTRVLCDPEPAHGRPGGRLVVVGLGVGIEQPVLSRVAPFFYGVPGQGFMARWEAALAGAGLRLAMSERRLGWAVLPVAVAQKDAA